MPKQTETTLEKLKELQRYYKKGAHYPEEAIREKLDMLIQILIDERKESV